jgi:drug/metabolite transporter (DMT)-like permease
MWILFAVMTVLLWGTSDVIFKKVMGGSSANTAFTLMAYNGLIYGSCALLLCTGMYVFTDFTFSLRAYLFYLPAALIFIASMFFYYKALPLLKLSIASPIANSSCLMTTLLCIFILNQEILPLHWFAIAVIVAGLMILSLRDVDSAGAELMRIGKKRNITVYALGVCFALVYFALDGLGSFYSDYAMEELSASQGFISHGITYMLAGVVCYIHLKRKEPAYALGRDKLKLTGGIIETGGEMTYLLAFSFGDAALASPFIACFAAVSVILSRVCLKEKLKPYQYAVVALMIAGMAMLALE